MTTRFIDGPAKGIVLELERTPIFLRAVHDSRTWAWDALDQLDDEPEPSETVFVYRLDGEVSRGFACSRGKNGGCRHFFHADYKLYDVQPSQEELRNAEFWQQWTHQEYERTKPLEEVQGIDY